MATISAARARNTFPLVRSTLIAGLAIGIAGGIEFGIFYFMMMNMGPVVFYQFVASALMGPSAFTGGYNTALIGLLLHFAISFVVAAVFLVAAARLSFLRRTVFVTAPLYGIAVNLLMGLVVLPFTALPKIAVTLPLLLNGIIGDALFIGLPLAITVWTTMRSRAQPQVVVK